MLKVVVDFRDKSLLRSLTELKDPMVVVILTVHSSTLVTSLTSLRPLELKSWCVPFFFLVKCWVLEEKKKKIEYIVINACTCLPKRLT